MSKRPDRFVIGDVVVKVRERVGRKGDGDSSDIGSTAKVISLDGDGMPYTAHNGYIDDTLWELEHIANSPLFKALA